MSGKSQGPQHSFYIQFTCIFPYYTMIIWIIQWSLYLRPQNVVLYCIWSENKGYLTQKIALWDQIKWSYNQEWS